MEISVMGMQKWVLAVFLYSVSFPSSAVSTLLSSSIVSASSHDLASCLARYIPSLQSVEFCGARLPNAAASVAAASPVVTVSFHIRQTKTSHWWLWATFKPMFNWTKRNKLQVNSTSRYWMMTIVVIQILKFLFPTLAPPFTHRVTLMSYSIYPSCFPAVMWASSEKCLLLWHHFLSKIVSHIFVSQLIQFYSNNATNQSSPFTSHTTPCCPTT